MPQKNKLSRRQERALRKSGLTPLTTSLEIAKRFGISVAKVDVALAGRSRERLYPTRHALIQKFRADPAKKWLLAHPKLWAYSIIEGLAPTHTGKGIHEELLRIARERGHPADEVPGVKVIYEYIQTIVPRTPEQRAVIRSTSHRRKAPNDLNHEQRQNLMVWADTFFNNRHLRGWAGCPADELCAYMIERACVDATYVRISGTYSEDRMKAAWFAYLNKAARFYRLRALANFFKNRSNQKETNLLDKHAVRTPDLLLNHETRFTTPLTKTQLEVLELLRENNSLGMIAKKRATSVQAVSEMVRSIRRKIRLE